MKTHNRAIVLAALALSLAACSDINPSSLGDVVRITANIDPQVQTKVTDAGDKFESGDRIKVINTSRTTNNVAVYAATVSGETTTWTTSDFLFWSGSGDNTFQAVHPATANFNSFTIPDLETNSSLNDADWMTASFTGSKGANGTNTVALSFTHRLAKVTVNIASWNSGVEEDQRTLGSAEIKTLSSTAGWNGTTLTGNNQEKWVKAAIREANWSFSAIVYPGEYAAATDFIKVYIGEDNTPLSVTLKDALTLAAGGHYVISLTVGKEKVDYTIEMIDVSVADWNDCPLGDVVATTNEGPSINGVTYNSIPELQDAIKAALSEAGVNSVTIDGSLTPEIHAAIISAIDEVRDGVVINGDLSADSVTYLVMEDYYSSSLYPEDSSTLTLISDLTESIALRSGEHLIVDLNGYSIHSPTNEKQLFLECGSATVRDSKGNGTIDRLVVASGKITFESGCVDFLDVTGCYSYFFASGGVITDIHDVDFGRCYISGTTTVVGSFDIDAKSVMFITGGAFAEDPSAYVNLKIYLIFQNSDGYFNVISKDDLPDDNSNDNFGQFQSTVGIKL